jgi:uncharacterized protein
MRIFVKLFLLLSFISTLIYADINFPKLTGRVVDNASLLSQTQKDSLTNILKQHEEKTTNQVVIVTLKSLEGQEIEEYGYQLGRHWGIGQKGKDNGILLIVAPNEKKVRIEVGYGLEGVITDKIAHDIIQNKIIPSFKTQDYPEGINKGTRSILEALDGEYTLSKQSSIIEDVGKDVDDWISIGFVILVIISTLYDVFTSAGKRGLRFYIALILATIVSIVVFKITYDFFFAAMAWVVTYAIIMPSSGGSGYDSGWSSSSSSGGFGGFSGGGGSFGGGGASGSW